MASKEVEFHEEASSEYEAAFDWYFARSELAASKFTEELSRAINLIAEAPQRWPDNIDGTRNSCSSDFLLLSYIGNSPQLFKFWPLPTGVGGLVTGKIACESLRIRQAGNRQERDRMC